VEATLEGRERLQAALEEQDIAQDRFEAAIGTSSEMRAYERLRRATRRVTEVDRQSEVPDTPARSTTF
jgi:hypothetical protein